ncbi:MAG: type IV pilus modification PilV family protein [Pseudomonadota bacterium]
MPTKRLQKGLSLIEVLVALTIFAFGVLGLLGMHATALATFSDAKYRADAALLADSLINQIWIDRVNLPAYAYSGGSGGAAVSSWVTNAVKAALPAADAVVAVAGSRVTVTITWVPPGAAQPRSHVAVATIQEP